MTTSDGSVRLAKFNGENYTLWKVKLKALLISRDLWGAVSPEEEDDDKKDVKNQEKALALLQLTVEDSILIKIVNAKTAAEALRILDEEYESKRPINRLLLKQQLYTVKIEESGDIDAYISVVDKIIQQLAAIGCKIEEEDAALALLLGLPPSWGNFKTTICVQADGNALRLAVVKAAIRTEHLTRKLNSAQISDYTTGGGEGALLAQLASCRVCHRPGHKTKDCRVKCFRCGKTGHLEKKCKEKEDEHENADLAQEEVAF